MSYRVLSQKVSTPTIVTKRIEEAAWVLYGQIEEQDICLYMITQRSLETYTMTGFKQYSN